MGECGAMGAKCAGQGVRVCVELDGAVVDVWVVRLDEEEGGENSVEELVRAGRYRSVRDGRRFLAGRRALRRILGGYVERVELEADAFGKLRVMCGGVKFSVAHAEGVGLVAVTAEREVGVDIDCVREIPEAGEIAEEYLGERVAGGDREFLEAWCRKEARLKVGGKGWSGEDDMEGMEVRVVEVGEGMVGAVAVGGS